MIRLPTRRIAQFCLCGQRIGQATSATMDTSHADESSQLNPSPLRSQPQSHLDLLDISKRPATTTRLLWLKVLWGVRYLIPTSSLHLCSMHFAISLPHLNLLQHPNTRDFDRQTFASSTYYFSTTTRSPSQYYFPYIPHFPTPRHRYLQIQFPPSGRQHLPGVVVPRVHCIIYASCVLPTNVSPPSLTGFLWSSMSESFSSWLGHVWVLKRGSVLQMLVIHASGGNKRHVWYSSLRWYSVARCTLWLFYQLLSLLHIYGCLDSTFFK